MNSKLTGAVAALALLAGATAASAQIEIKIATLAPEGTPWYDALATWETNVESASNGEIDMQIFTGGQLGNEYDVYKQIQRGRIDIGAFSQTVIADHVAEVSLMMTPFLFDDVATIDCIYDGALGDELATLVEAEGFKHLSWGETGWVHIYAKDDLSNVDDVEGYKARVDPQPTSRLMWNAVGANQTEIPYAESPAALQTGLIKAGESATISYVAFGLGKVAPHFMKTYHLHQAGATVMGEKTWNKLSAEHQQIIMDGLPPQDEVRASIRGLGDLMLGGYIDAGGPVHELTPEQRAAWKAKVEPSWPDLVSDLGGRSEELWPKLLAAKASCEG